MCGKESGKLCLKLVMSAPQEWLADSPPEQEQQQETGPPPQYYYYPPDEPKTSFFDGISKQILFLIFIAFVVGLFFGKSFNVPIIIQKSS